MTQLTPAKFTEVGQRFYHDIGNICFIQLLSLDQVTSLVNDHHETVPEPKKSFHVNCRIHHKYHVYWITIFLFYREISHRMILLFSMLLLSNAWSFFDSYHSVHSNFRVPKWTNAVMSNSKNIILSKHHWVLWSISQELQWISCCIFLSSVWLKNSITSCDIIVVAEYYQLLKQRSMAVAKLVTGTLSNTYIHSIRLFVFDVVKSS